MNTINITWKTIFKWLFWAPVLLYMMHGTNLVNILLCCGLYYWVNRKANEIVAAEKQWIAGPSDTIDLILKALTFFSALYWALVVVVLLWYAYWFVIDLSMMG